MSVSWFPYPVFSWKGEKTKASKGQAELTPCVICLCVYKCAHISARVMKVFITMLQIQACEVNFNT